MKSDLLQHKKISVQSGSERGFFNFNLLIFVSDHVGHPREIGKKEAGCSRFGAAVGGLDVRFLRFGVEGYFGKSDLSIRLYIVCIFKMSLKDI